MEIASHYIIWPEVVTGSGGEVMEVREADEIKVTERPMGDMMSILRGVRDKKTR